MVGSFCTHTYAASWVHSHAPSIRSHRGTYEVFPDFQPMRISEEPVCIYLFRQNPFFTSLHLRSPVYDVPPLDIQYAIRSHRRWLRRLLLFSEKNLCTKVSLTGSADGSWGECFTVYLWPWSWVLCERGTLFSNEKYKEDLSSAPLRCSLSPFQEIVSWDEYFLWRTVILKIFRKAAK